MKQEPHVAHDEASIEMLREDPQFAAEYLNAVLEDGVQEERKLEQMLLEGINSGPGVEHGTKEWDAFWESIYARIRDEASKKTKATSSDAL